MENVVDLTNRLLSFIARKPRLRIIYQATKTECGLACLAMIAKYHGNNVTLQTLRTNYPPSLRGTTLRRLLSIGETIGLQSTPLRQPQEEISDLLLPAMLFWNDSHFVVLSSVHSKYQIFDPALGIYNLDAKDFSKHYSGVCVCFSKRHNYESIKLSGDSFKVHFFRAVQAERRHFSWLFFLGILTEIVALYIPYKFGTLLDISNSSSENDVYIYAALLLVFLAILGYILTQARNKILSRIGEAVSFHWTSAFFDRLIFLPISFFERRGVAVIAEKFESLQVIQNTLTTSFLTIILDGIISGVFLIALFIINWQLCSITILIILSYLSVRAFLYRKLWTANDDQLAATTRVNSELQESIEAIHTIKVAKLEDVRLKRLLAATSSMESKKQYAQYLAAGFNSLNGLFGTILRTTIMVIGAYFVLTKQITIGMLVTFSVYAYQMFSRGARLIDIVIEFKLLSIHTARLDDVFLHSNNTLLGSSGHQANGFTIRVSDLWYRYTSSDPWIFEGLNLEVRENEAVAIMGVNGCGKTTLLKLILGLLKPERGTITIGGVPIHQLEAKRFRNLFGVVLQEDELISGTIKENVSMFDAKTSDTKVQEACKAAYIHEDITAMTMQYNTLVGGIGMALSAGQKQRILLARAIYNNPDILILDEATSHVDQETNKAIYSVLARRHCTRIIISHRDQAVDNVDRVINLGPRVLLLEQ